MPKKCGLSISFQGENKSVAYTYIHTISFLMKNSYYILYVSLIVLNWISNLTSLLGHSNWALVYGLEWDHKGTNKTLAPMGLGLFCQLLTSLKFSLIIFNTTIYIIVL